MKNKIIQILILFFIIILSSYFFINSSIGSDQFTNIKKIIPEKYKIFLKENIFFKKYQKELNLTIIEKKEEIKNIKKNILINKEIYLNRNKKVEQFEVFQSKISLEKYNTFQLQTSKHPGSIGNSYLDFFGDYLFMVSADGIISVINKYKFFKSSDILKADIIETNLNKLIKHELFFENSQFGIKDILISNSKLYITFTNEYKKNCFNTAILSAEINFKKLIFSEFFVPNECISINNESLEFNAHQSGGRLVNFTNEKFIFSIGEYRDRKRAQDLKTIFGKIISIDIKTKNYEIISLGHRNVQGLYYDIDTNSILSSEHGPKGGDEININLLNETKIKNFGWPISSYGEHYKNNEEIYKKFPLYKSHSDYGFEEPLVYFSPSIGISQILILPKKYIDSKFRSIIYGSLGKDPKEGDMSLYFANLKENKIINNLTFNLNERVRDIIYDNETNTIFLFLESTSSIGILRNIDNK